MRPDDRTDRDAREQPQILPMRRSATQSNRSAVRRLLPSTVPVTEFHPATLFHSRIHRMEPTFVFPAFSLMVSLFFSLQKNDIA